ncbi:hypothetical protein [Ruminococcus sp.]|jgi:hypothetical protein|uniref:hypothetical protein n=1 Tax=Ruminococcus sp. TaxID=41978 RepID=UPI003520CDE6
MKSCENCRHFTRCPARSRGVVCNCYEKYTERKDETKKMAEEKVLVFKYAEPLGCKKAQDKILKYLNLGE